MWYEELGKKKELDYSKPIVAICGNEKHILLPQLASRGYSVKGYNWFDISLGKYNSCTCWATAELAVKEYSGYSIYNVSFELNKI